MSRPNRAGFVCSQPPHSRRPSIDPPETRQRADSYQTEHRVASRRTETADRNAQSYRVTDSLPVADFHIRIDDRFRVDRLTAQGIGIIGGPSRRPERNRRRRDAAFHCKVQNDDRPDCVAGTQGGGRSGRLGRPPSGSESGASQALTATRLAEMSAMPFGLASLSGRVRWMFHPRCGFSSPRFARELLDPSP